MQRTSRWVQRQTQRRCQLAAATLVGRAFEEAYDHVTRETMFAGVVQFTRKEGQLTSRAREAEVPSGLEREGPAAFMADRASHWQCQLSCS